MSRTPSRAARRAVVAVGAAAAAAAVLAAPASAAFTTTKCAGDSISGAGASFAKTAQNSAFIPAFTNVCAGFGSAPGITYDAVGSGSGRRTFGERTKENTDGSKSRSKPNRFVGSDEPVTPANLADINKGTDAPGDEGLAHFFPIAVGGVAVVVNLPDGCSIATQANGNGLTTQQQGSISDFGSSPDVSRLQLTRAQLEGVYAADSSLDTWGELVPWINDGNGVADAGDAACASTPIVRVVRRDSSGTTFAFKEYLGLVNPSRGWATTFAPSTTWPSQGTAVTGSADGAGALVDKVYDTDGSIGYADLATARAQKGAAFERQNGADDKYWVKLQSKDLSTFVDPANAADGFKAGGARGSSCVTATISNVPGGDAPSLGDWTPATANDSTPKGYGICTPTYGMVWDDYATPYKLEPGFNAAAEERKARTVKDYFESILNEGQQNLFTYDYAPLSSSVKAISAAAVAKIGFDKTGGTGNGGGGTTPTPTPTPAPNVTPIVVPAPQPPAVVPPTVAPSNVFSITKLKDNKKRAALVSVDVPGPGAVQVELTAKVKTKKGKKKVTKTVTVGSAASQPTAAGTVDLTVKLNSAGRKALKKKLKVTVEITFTPAGGQPNTLTKTVTLKKATKKKKSKK